MPVQEGDVLAGKYRVERVLGAGGMGVVVAAYHLQLDQRVALKFLLPSAVADGETVARFAREARAASRIKNEHVVRVLDVGTLESGAPYMVMEYLEGQDLAQLMTSGPLEPQLAADYLLQACEAISEAHTARIVHRDLKPGNLFVVAGSDGRPHVKVLDFGISKIVQVEGATPPEAMTRTAAMLGSPLYMSPEQLISSKDVDARTDIWAIGVILYEMVEGHPPFNGNSMPQLCTAILHAAPAPFSRVSEALQRVIARCLQKDRTQRFPDLTALAAALAEVASASGRASAERIALIQQAHGLDATVAGTSGRLPPRSSPNATHGISAGGGTQSTWDKSNSAQEPRRALPRRVAVAAGSVVVLVGVVAVGFAARPRPDAGAPTAPAASLPAAGVQSVALAARPDAAELALVAASAGPTAPAASSGASSRPGRPVIPTRRNAGKRVEPSASIPSGAVPPGGDELFDRPK